MITKARDGIPFTLVSYHNSMYSYWHLLIRIEHWFHRSFSDIDRIGQSYYQGFRSTRFTFEAVANHPYQGLLNLGLPRNDNVKVSRTSNHPGTNYYRNIRHAGSSGNQDTRVTRKTGLLDGQNNQEIRTTKEAQSHGIPGVYTRRPRLPFKTAISGLPLGLPRWITIQDC